MGTETLILDEEQKFSVKFYDCDGEIVESKVSAIKVENNNLYTYVDDLSEYVISDKKCVYASMLERDLILTLAQIFCFNN